MRRTTVASGTAELAVFERGAATPDNDSVVLVHGWPDSHAVWDLVADRLAARGHHVVSFDVRGVGASGPAMTHRPYRLTEMAADIDRVVAATCPDRAVHLVGHDWGGVEGWEYVSTDACLGRVSTFTTVSGPNLDHLGHVMRRDVRAAAVQGAKSLYTIVLSIPGVRIGIWRLGFGRLFRLWLRLTEGVRPESGYPGDDLVDVAIAAVPLYRTNIFPRLFRPRIRPARVPVHQVVATKDNYVSASVLAHSAAFVEDFTRTEIDAGHWSPRTHPDEITDAVHHYVTQRSAHTAPDRNEHDTKRSPA